MTTEQKESYWKRQYEECCDLLKRGLANIDTLKDQLRRRNLQIKDLKRELADLRKKIEGFVFQQKVDRATIERNR